MKKGQAFFYLNANDKIGSGHFWRCLSIANELIKFDVSISFLYSSLHDSLAELLQQNNYSAYQLNDITAGNFIEIVNSKNTDNNTSLIIIDSDNISFYKKEFQLNIIGADIRLMLITVNPDFHYYAHIVLNQNIIACHQNYSVENYTRPLLGPEYFIYTPQFRKIGIQPVKPIRKNIFISFGSADPCHFTFQLMNKILNERYFDSFSFHVVVGSLNQDYENIKKLCELHQDHVQLYHNIPDVSNVMLKCDLAICAPGLMYWELALMGVRSVLFSSSLREKKISLFLHDNGYAYTFHQYDEIFNDEKFELFRTFLSMIKEEYFYNFSALRKKINPEGINKICSEIDNVLKN